ncbi:ABC transporter substrate-binding protein [Micromonospora sp. DT46]|uniref:ABC transporter substrate-binding protein n=1 Tax=unclassified Micromonospora TaxID=2617518 RepID=UPI00124B1746|nr:MULTISPECIES: ABC transporter substrate-binding protein [unclassified Micromonospora]KAB1142996.1 carbohydrate ABC transporter substrate-binding protein [Micromonospora sp. AMSO12t]WSG05113.1 ABC transporter substrate-binding protein [Micromonospora sp. NBC_01740]
MSRPRTRAEYLARLVPPSVAGLNRRSLLAGAAGTTALLGTGLLAGCGSDSGGSDAKTVSLGSNQSDPKPKEVIAKVMDGFRTSSGLEVAVNTVDHNTFQENINNYLQGKPDDVFMWFAGYRMRFFAARGLAGDLSDVWGKLSGMSDAFRKASTGDDGKQYFVPSSYYPWAVFYRKSVWQQNGYQVPKTLDDLTALAGEMKKDGLTPIAFADKDGWPAMGTFDILNLRINGYQFHIDLMAGKESWTSDKVKKVFDTWRGLLPLHQPDSLGRTWQEAAQSLQQKKSGMYLLGLFVGQQFDGADLADLDFFTFPEIDPAIGAKALDAPIDGYMMARKPKQEANARKLLEYVGSKAAADITVKSDPSTLVANSEADTSGYSALQKKAAELVGSATEIAQFLDRDTRPDFASTVIIPALQQFIKDPKDIDGLTSSIENQKKSIFTD